MFLYTLVCLVLAIIFGGSYYAYRLAFYSPNKNRDEIPSVNDPHYVPYKAQMRDLFHALKNKPCEFVSIRSTDGLTLNGRYYHQKDDAPLSICFHGYKSCWLTDFCGGADLAWQMGQNILLIDERAHGKSQGRTITFGIKERHDLMCWVDYALNRFGPDTKILLYGVSMGAATVLMASGMDLPDNVKGIVADSPYSSPLDIILEVGRQKNYPVKLIKPFVILGAKIYGGFDVKEATAMEAIKHSKTPILIIHGEDDTFVPPEMSVQMQKSNPEMIRLHIFPGAYHVLSYMVDTPRYHRLVKEFMSEIL